MEPFPLLAKRFVDQTNERFTTIVKGSLILSVCFVTANAKRNAVAILGRREFLAVQHRGERKIRRASEWKRKKHLGHAH